MLCVLCYLFLADRVEDGGEKSNGINKCEILGASFQVYDKRGARDARLVSCFVVVRDQFLALRR